MPGKQTNEQGYNRSSGNWGGNCKMNRWQNKKKHFNWTSDWKLENNRCKSNKKKGSNGKGNK